MQLEQMFGHQPRVAQEESRTTYFVVGDLESLSASALYSNEKIVDLKSLNLQMHFHEDKDGNITNAKFKDYNQNTLRSLTNYEAAMGDLYAQQMNLPRIDKGSRS